MRLGDDVLPNPDACLVTGILPETLQREGIPEVQAWEEILRQFTVPETCVVGYNSLRFDDEFVRYGLYRHLFDPYSREWQNGCSRWDILDLVRATGGLRRDGIEWPQTEEGLPVYKLEELTKANGISHSNAHDALADCEFLIHLMKTIAQKLPNYYKEIIETTSKEGFFKKLNSNKVHFNCYYIPRSKIIKTYPFTPLIAEFNLSKYLPIFNLSHNPDDFIDLSYPELELLINSKKSPFKRFAINNTQPTICLETLLDDGITIEDQNLLKDRAQKIHANESFIERVTEIYLSLIHI